MRPSWFIGRLAQWRHGAAVHGNKTWRLILCVAMAVTVASPAFAQGRHKAQPRGGKAASGKVIPYVILRADEVTYDEKTGKSTASGNVEISHGERLLRADQVTYQEKTDTFTAISLEYGF